MLHPHPHFGGDRFHPFVEKVYEHLPRSGIGAVRFDFSSADPTTACDEIKTAIETTTTRWPSAVVMLAGYSFGASMAMRTLEPSVGGWFLVAPPAATIGDAAIAEDARPKLILVPENDQFSSADGVADATARWRSTELDVIPGDHYLFDSLPLAVGKCLDFVKRFTSGA